MSAARVWAGFVMLLLGQAPLAAQTAGLGSPVRLERIGVAQQTRGELIAVSADSVWVLAGTELVSVPVDEVRLVRVKRRPIGATGILAWAAIGGLATGVGLSIACASYEEGDCGSVLAGTVVLWAAWGGIWAAVAGSNYSGIGRSQFETRLRPFARFPQGLPSGFDPSLLRSTP